MVFMLFYYVRREHKEGFIIEDRVNFDGCVLVGSRVANSKRAYFSRCEGTSMREKKVGVA